MRIIGNKIRGKLRTASKLVALGGLLALALVAWEMLALHGERVQAVAQQEAAAGWGDEALAAVDQVWPVSLIAPANACGLGASSCFQCHNGFRASSPSTEAWHSQHEAVDHSCVGCHKGNARILREDMAHRNMIPDPRLQPADTCASCHHGEDQEQLVAQYSHGN